MTFTLLLSVIKVDHLTPTDTSPPWTEELVDHPEEEGGGGQEERQVGLPALLLAQGDVHLRQAALVPPARSPGPGPVQPDPSTVLLRADHDELGGDGG